MSNNCEPVVVLEFYCLFFRTSWGVGVLNSTILKLIRMLEWNTKHFPPNLQSGLTLSNFRDAGVGFELRNQIRQCKTVCIKSTLYLINYNRMRTQWSTKGNRDAGSSCSTDIFGISGRGGWTPQTTPPRYATVTINHNTILGYNNNRLLRHKIFSHCHDVIPSSTVTIQCVPLVTEPGISLIILTPMKSTFVVWEMKRNVSVVRLIVETRSSNILISGKIIKEMPGSVVSRTHCINLMDAIPLCDITKAYTDIYFNTQQLLLNTTLFCTWLFSACLVLCQWFCIFFWFRN